MSGNSGNGSLHTGSPTQPGIAATGGFCLRLLGPFELTDPFGQQIDIGSKKNRLLLAILACAPGRSMSREKLAGLLWSEHGEEQARNSLRQALAVLRKDLKGQDAAFFSATDTVIALHPTHVSIDIEAFLADARSTERDRLAAAVDVWRGPVPADDVVRVQLRQPESEWNTDGFVIMAGSLAALGRKNEAEALARRGVAKFPGLLSIERFALNRSWPPGASKVMVELMHQAGFPACATREELLDTPQPARLPECTG